MSRLAVAFLLFLLAACQSLPVAGGPLDEAERWKSRSAAVTIVRDDWGIAHVRGRSDADAVFGGIYAQAEDDFNRIETNYLNALGRLAEAEGEGALWQDLRMRLFIDPDDLKARFSASPDWLKDLMIAWADGLNFYLHEHPEVRPRVLTRFEPWMALSFTEGSIGGDIERISLPALEAFYSGEPERLAAAPAAEREPGGSNGIALAPGRSDSGDPLLLINPHTSFFFRSELQMTSDEGLNAYGAATWGQFFVYQGFNEALGWMHTSSGVDVVDEFLETIVRRKGQLYYRYGAEERPVRREVVTLRYRLPNGSLGERQVTVFRTHHGPVVRSSGDHWVSTALMHRPVEALSQSFLRTKARDFRSFMRVMELKSNSSNNTVYADRDGNIAYLHPQFIPRRDDRFDYARPVDGSRPETDWQGLHDLAEMPMLLNPPTGWIQNTNNAPWSAAGPHSPRAGDFPRYMDLFGQNPRGIHALALLSGTASFSAEELMAAAYDEWLPAFAELVPPLVEAHARLDEELPLARRLAEPISILAGWDHRWATGSVPTTLAIFWGEELLQRVGGSWGPGMSTYKAMAGLDEAARLEALASACDRLEGLFGTWRVPWGEVNRFQRLTGDIVQPFSDAAPSLPVGFTSARWGSLASFGARPWPGTRRWYGTSGNSFVAVVLFGDRVRAWAVSAGGESGNPASPHFDDQASLYAAGGFRPVRFHRDELEGHIESLYAPGSEPQRMLAAGSGGSGTE